MDITRIKKGKPHLLTDVQKWGGKGDNLLKLSEVFDIPEGFVISSDTYGNWIHQAQLDGFLRQLPNGEFSEQDYQKVRQQFLSTSLQTDLVSRLEREFSRLRNPVAVRSSSVNEDGSKNSYAGQHESILGVADFDGFLNAVREVYASILTI